MSDINPLTGSPKTPMPIQVNSNQPPKPQTVFPDNPLAQRLDEEMNSEEAQAYAELAFKASNTKFATGDRETDIRNYLQYKKHVAGLLSFLNG